MWGYKKKQGQRTYETEQKVMKSPRMVHEPPQHVTNGIPTSCRLQSPFLPTSAESRDYSSDVLCEI